MEQVHDTTDETMPMTAGRDQRESGSQLASLIWIPLGIGWEKNALTEITSCPWIV